jgi:hypothetical protein
LTFSRKKSKSDACTGIGFFMRLVGHWNFAAIRVGDQTRWRLTLSHPSRTARCGPACRVVWQGRGQMAASYADVGH